MNYSQWWWLWPLWWAVVGREWIEWPVEFHLQIHPFVLSVLNWMTRSTWMIKIEIWESNTNNHHVWGVFLCVHRTYVHTTYIWGAWQKWWDLEVRKPHRCWGAPRLLHSLRYCMSIRFQYEVWTHFREYMIIMDPPQIVLFVWAKFVRGWYAESIQGDFFTSTPLKS